MKKKRKFSLIICGYNEENNLDRCITSCLNQNYPKDNYEIIYVDNNSKDNSIKVAKKYPINVLIEKKQGLSEARNKGILNSKGKLLVFLDADLKLDKNYLKCHEKTFKTSLVGAGGGKVLPLKKTFISDYLGVSLFESYPRFKKNKFVRTYPGCNLTIRKKVLEEIGFFKEGLITPKGVTRFSEDKEICERIREKGYKILYNSKALIYHKNTYEFKKLLKIWVKGAKGRLNLIKQGKKDPFSILFKYNLPIIFLSLIIMSFLFNKYLFLSLIIFCLVNLFLLSIKSFIESRMFFQSFLVKPFLDLLSLFIINLSVLYYRWEK